MIRGKHATLRELEEWYSAEDILWVSEGLDLLAETELEIKQEMAKDVEDSP